MNRIVKPKAGNAEAHRLLHAHLERAARLYRAQVLAWRHEIASHKPDSLWGMLQISDGEIDALVKEPFIPPGEFPAALAEAMAPQWREAERLSREIDTILAALPDGQGFRLDHLERRLGLTALERDVVVVCLLPELDSRYRRLVGYLLDDATQTRPTVDLVLRLLHPLLDQPLPARALFSPGASLRRHHLVRLAGGELAGDAQVVLAPRIVLYLLDDDGPDRLLDGRLRPHPPAEAIGDLPLEEHLGARVAALPGWIAARRSAGTGSTIHLHGAVGSGRRSLAAAVAANAGRTMLVADGPALWPTAEAGRQAVELAVREAWLNDADLLVDGFESFAEGPEREHAVDALLALADERPMTLWLAATRPWHPRGGALVLDLPPPLPGLRRRLWRQGLPGANSFAQPGPDPDTLAALLADAFQLNAGQIGDAVQLALGLAVRRRPNRPELTVDDLYEACRRQTSGRLLHLARRIEPVAELTFDDLALRPESQRQIDDLRQRIRLRGAVHGSLGFSRRIPGAGGFTALFTGTSGTGKTMAAQLLAHEQGIDLYKVDLSAVVSKYVGETEKNLEQIFRQAEDANALLFFDEADALFGKRGDVKEARDRWANLEVNYLLQRVEEFAGVVILATNLRQNIDEAFLRRIHTIVEFPFPDAAMRARIWRGMFPSGVTAPGADIIAELAERFELAGGSIRNATLDAAFRAMASARGAKPRIGERHLVVAICREYLKLGKPVTQGEFGERYYAMVAKDILGEKGGR